MRGNEIACRNGWDADSWVSAEIDPSGTGVSPDDQAVASGTADEITSILPARYEPLAPSPAIPPTPTYQSEDIVVGHAPFPGYVAPEKDARDLVTNPRAAILRAREQFKSRQKREGRISDYEQRPPLIVDATNDFPASDWNLPDDDKEDWGPASREDAPFPVRQSVTPSPRINIVPPVSRDEMQRPYPTITSFAEDAERFESIPDDPVEFARSSSTREEDDLAFTDSYYDEYDSNDGYADDRLDFEQDFVTAVPRQRRESFFERFMRDRRDRKAPVPMPEIETYVDEYIDDFPAVRDPDLETEFAYSTRQHDIDPREDRSMTDQYLDEPDYTESPDFEVHEVRNRRPDMQAWSVDERQADSRLNPFHREPRRAPESRASDDPAIPVSRDDLDELMPETRHLFDSYGEVRHEQQRNQRIEPEHDRRAQRRYVPEPVLTAHQNASSSVGPAIDRESARNERQPHASLPSDSYDDFQLFQNDDPSLEFADLPRWNDSVVDRATGPTKPAPVAPPFAAGVPKVCRTCRDYRPSENPERGWCNNAWAFTHRRMVDAETLSCGQSALGPWWTANDNYWQGPGDVARHAQETPLLDRLLASRFERYDDQRRVSGGGRG